MRPTESLAEQNQGLHHHNPGYDVTHSVDVTAATLYEAIAQSVWSHAR